MKTRKSLFLFNFLCALLCTSFLYAQPGWGVNDGDGGGEDDYCLRDFEITVRLTNLDLFAPAGNGGEEFFPSNRPPMDLDVTIGDNDFSFSINGGFTLVDTFSNGAKIYELTIIIEDVNICSLCPETGGTLNIPIILSLTNAGGFPYHACSYNGTGDIFNFPQSAYNNGEVPPCNNSDYTTTSDYMTVDCDLAGFGGDSGGSRQRLDLDAFPNPFDSEINVSWDNKIYKATEVKLFNSLGKQVFQDFVLDKYQNSIQIQTESLSKGIYFLKMISEEREEIFQLIKF